MGGVHCAVENYINSMAELQTTMDNCQKTILAEVRRLVEYQSSCRQDGDSLHSHNGPWYAPDDPTLPPPWKGLVDGSSGSIYYWNTETNITQYEKPKPVFFLSTDHYSCVSEPPVPNTNYHHNSSLTHPIIPYPSQHGLPFTTSAYPSEPAYGYLSSPYPWDQPFLCDPYSTSPHNSFYSPITCPHTEPKEPIVPPYQLPYAADLIPPSSLASTVGGTSCTEKDDVPPPEMKKSLRRNLKMKKSLRRNLKMKKSLRRNLKMRSHVMMKRKPRSQFPRRRRAQNNGGSEGDLCKASSLVAANWDSTVPSDKSVDSLSQLTLSYRRPSPLSDDLMWETWRICCTIPLTMPTNLDLALLLKLPPILKPTATGDEVFAKVSAGNCSYPQNSPHYQPDSLIEETESLTTGEETLVGLWDDSGGLRPMNCKFNVSASLFDYCHFLRTISALLLKNMDTCGTNSNILSKHDSEFMLINHASFLHFGYERKNLHIPGWFEKIQKNAELLSDESWKDWKHDIITGILVDQFHDNKLNLAFFRECREPDKKRIRDAFFSLEIFVSSVTSKLLFSESSRGGDISMEKAMEETFLQTTALTVVISTTCAHATQLSYALHLVEALATETISADVDLHIFEAVIIHKLQLGLSSWIVVLPFVVIIKILLVMEINSNGLLTASIEDFRNKELVVCSLITTATSRKFWGHCISLEKSKLDGQLNLLFLCIFRMKLQLVGRFCIVHSRGKQLAQSHFLMQLKHNSGVIYFTILVQFNKTYGVICFVLLVEGYLRKYLLYSEANITTSATLKHKKEALNDIGSVAFICASLVMFQHSHFAGEARLNDIVEFPKDSTIGNALAMFWFCGVFSLSSLNADWVPHLLGLIEMWFKAVIGDPELHFAKESNITRTGEIATGFNFNSGAALGIHNSDISMVYSIMCLPHLKELFLEMFAVGLLMYCYLMDAAIILCFPLLDFTFGQPIQQYQFSVQLDFQVTTVMDVYLESRGRKIGLLIFTRCMNQQMLGNTLSKFSHHTFLQMAMKLLYHYILGYISVNYVVLLVGHHFGVNVECGTLKGCLSDVGRQLHLDMTSLLRLGCICNEMAHKEVSSVMLAVDWCTVKTHVLDTAVSSFMITPIVGEAWALLCIFKITKHMITRHIQGLKLIETLVLSMLAFIVISRLHVGTILSTLLECLTFYIDSFYFPEVVMMEVRQLASQSTTQTLFDLALLFNAGHNKFTAADGMLNEVTSKVIVDALIPFIMLINGCCGDCNAQKPKTNSFLAKMWGDDIQSPKNLIEDPSDDVVHTKATWLQLEDIWFNFPLAQL